ncbi:MAG: hypothetical protein AAF217_05335 [Pseudomonadota bacterium]
MLLQSLLYFLLGFLAAILIALAIAPTIWNRAVFLTTKRAEKSLPLNLNEIQAQKDHMRAEHAMVLRRYELTLDEVRKREASQLIEINKRRNDIVVFRDTIREEREKVQNLEAGSSSLRESLGDSQLNIDKLTNERASLLQRMKELENDFAALKDENATSLIELEEKRQSLENMDIDFLRMKSQFAAIDTSDDEKIKQIGTLTGDLAKSTRNLERTTAQRDKARIDLDDKKAMLADIKSQLKEKREELRKLQPKKQNSTQANTDESSKVVELEAELAAMTLQFEALQGSTKNQSQKTPGSSDADLKQRSQALVSDIIKTADSKTTITVRQANALKKRVTDLAATTAATIINDKGTGLEISQILDQRQSDPNESSNANSLANKIEKQIVNQDQE